MATPCEVEGRLIKVTERKRQRVRIHAPEGAEEKWQYIFEFDADQPHVSRSDIEEHATVAELVDWLTSCNARQIEDLSDVKPLSITPDPDWLREAEASVDRAVDFLIDEFRTTPFLHRVEHSFHLRLYERLTRDDIFKGSHEIGSTGHRTQLIHKEWPETRPRLNKGGRGNFDFAILAPTQLAGAKTEEFTGGHIKAAIIIEVGFNYGYTHLAADHQKLVDSGATSGYLVDVRRIGKRDQGSETLICNTSTGIKGAYAYTGTREGPAFKYVGDDKIND